MTEAQTLEDAEQWVEKNDFFVSTFQTKDNRTLYDASGWFWPTSFNRNTGKPKDLLGYKIRIHRVNESYVEAVQAIRFIISWFYFGADSSDQEVIRKKGWM